VNGVLEKLLDMECSHGPTETNMKESGTCLLKTERVLTISIMETITEETIKTESLMDLEYILGQMEVFMKAVLKMV
jgi:hypothetical protein